jgi:hypothetical protein
VNPLDTLKGSDSGSRVLRKMLLTLATGGGAYVVTNVAQQPQIWAVFLSVFIGGVTLVVQFLIDFENRLEAVEKGQIAHAATIERMVRKGFSEINEATELFGLVEASALRNDVVTQLVRHATRIDTSAELVHSFAQLEITRMSEFLKALSEKSDITCEGEDSDWLLRLTQAASASIDAVSMTTPDGVDEEFWTSELGRRYLEAQRDALRRGVAIRRVFILEHPQTAASSPLGKVLRRQKVIGIQVRVLDPSAVPDTRRSSMFDFIVFDQELSYELMVAASFADGVPPGIINTRLVRHDQSVKERVRRFEDLWEHAQEIE